MKIPRYSIAAAAVLVALVVAARSAGAQQVERVEVKFTVTDSTLPAIPEGQVIRIVAEDPSTTLAFPLLERVKLLDTVLEIQSSSFVVRGQVSSSSVEGISPNALLECAFDFATAECSVSVGNDDAPSLLGGTVKRLHVVEQ